MPHKGFRYGHSIGPAIGVDDSHDPSTVPDTALTIGENARVQDGIVVCRGGQSKASAAADSAIVGMIDVPELGAFPPWGLVAATLINSYSAGGYLSPVNVYFNSGGPGRRYASFHHYNSGEHLRHVPWEPGGNPGDFDIRNVFLLNGTVYGLAGLVPPYPYLYRLDSPGSSLLPPVAPAAGDLGASTNLGSVGSLGDGTFGSAKTQQWALAAIRAESGSDVAYLARNMYVGLPSTNPDWIEVVRFNGTTISVSAPIFTSTARLGLYYPHGATLAWAAGAGLVVTAYQTSAPAGPVVMYQQTAGGAWAQATDADGVAYVVSDAVWFGGALYMLVGPDGNYVLNGGSTQVPVRIKKLDLATGVISTLVTYASAPTGSPAATCALDGQFVIHGGELYLVRRGESAADYALLNFGIYHRVNDGTWTRVKDGGDGTTCCMFWWAQEVNGQFLVTGEWRAYHPDTGVTGAPVSYSGNPANRPAIYSPQNSVDESYPTWRRRVNLGSNDKWGARGVYAFDPGTLAFTPIWRDTVTTFDGDSGTVGAGEYLSYPAGPLVYKATV